MELETIEDLICHLHVYFKYLDLYAEQVGQSHQVSKSLERLKNTVEEELGYMRSLMGLLGTMDTLFSVAESSTQSNRGSINTDNTDSHTITEKSSVEQLQPSLTASEETS